MQEVGHALHEACVSDVQRPAHDTQHGVRSLRLQEEQAAG